MSEKTLMKGNEAIAEAAIRAGCRHFFGYPITPQTEVAAYMAKRMPKVGGVFLQAESEVAAINMVYGASSAGMRVMTSSSSPGVSLKSEGVSYLAGCDLPAVIINIQRCGPGLGGIMPAQSDYFQATRGMGHGDFHLIVLAPNSVQEAYDMTAKAFDLADKYRMTVMILGDGILGQMMEPVDLELKDQAAPTVKDWCVGPAKGHNRKNVVNSLALDPIKLEKQNYERFDRYNAVSETEQRAEEYLMDDAEIVIAAFGATSRIAKNAIKEARDKGIKVGLIRPMTLWPFPSRSFAKAAEKAKAFISVEMNMGQMIDDIELAIRCSKPVHLCNHTGGVVPLPEEILAKIESINGGSQ